MEEIEVLEAVNTDKFVYSRLVSISDVVSEIPVATVNGQVVQTQKVQQAVICCPACSLVLMKFDAGIRSIDVIQAFVQENERLENDVPKYCPQCGQKLSYKRH